MILNDKELALHLDPSGKIVTTWTIRKWRFSGMPSIQIGKRIFYRLDSVLKWLDELEKGGQTEPELQYGKLRRLD